MSDSSFLPIGTLLSRQYTILQYIGAGGFGKTYLVEDQLGEKKVVKEFFISSMCTRDVATQSVTVSVAENRQSFQEQLGKFKEEARRIYSLSHPNIVKVSALFDENDTAYYVMDYIEGESLAQKSRREKLSESQIMRYLDQMLSALDYIHSRGITHLDIKPGNIMIDRNDNVVLIDFGASKLFNAQSINKTMMTSMRPPFTPGYAPIEQENGDVSDMGPHCDIYALGATLYNLFTGEKAPSPFVIFQKGLPSISQASPLMQKVIKEAMAFDVNHRIKNVAEFRAKLSEDCEETVPVIQEDTENPTIEVEQPIEIAISETAKLQPLELAPQVEEVPISVKQTPKTTRQNVSPKEVVQGPKPKKRWDKWMLLFPIIIVAVMTTIGVIISKNNNEGENTEIFTEIKYENNTITIPGTDISYKMVFVEGGAFQMGSNDSEAEADEKPVHSVTLSDYYIGETEVTQGLWEAVMGTNIDQQRKKSPNSDIGLVGLGSDYAMYYVSWNDCQEFIEKLNQLTGKSFRLPTEAEWEYAARGGNKSRGYKYSGSNSIGDVAWYVDNSTSMTHPVGTKLPNELGIYDMSGNVYEWCGDKWSYSYYSSSPSLNPTGPITKDRRYVYRGGCRIHEARRCHVATRNCDSPGSRYTTIGFRLALCP